MKPITFAATPYDAAMTVLTGFGIRVCSLMADDHIFYEINLPRHPDPIGSINLNGSNWIDDKIPAVSYDIHKKWRGNAYAAKAVALLTEHAFEKLGMPILAASIYKSNIASVRAAEKAGYSFHSDVPAYESDDPLRKIERVVNFTAMKGVWKKPAFGG